MAIISDKLRAVMEIDRSASVIEHSGRLFGWGTLADAVDQLDDMLVEMGCPENGRVGVFLRNRPGHIAAFLTLLVKDRCLVTLNPLYPDDVMAKDLAELDLGIVIGESQDLRRQAIAEQLKESGSGIIEIDGYLGPSRKIAGPAPGRTLSTSTDVAIEMLTSGTTGKPKRIPLSRRAFDSSFAAFATYEKGRQLKDSVSLKSSTTMVVNPLTHIGGIYGAIGALMSGRRICLLDRFSVEEWIAAVERNKLKVAPAVPAALRMIYEANLPREKFASLSAIISGTAPLRPELVDDFMKRYGVPILSNYGATEFAGAIAGWSLPDFQNYWTTKRGAAGRIHSNVQARVVHPETSLQLAPGEEGILELKGEQIAGDEDWLRTTDRAVIDEDGFLFIRGRSDNAIVRGGFKIHPDDVVQAIESYPSVREAAVVGIADERLGEVPVAAIILADGVAGFDERDLDTFLKDRLLPYQRPVRYAIVEDFPRTGSMKPSRPGLLAMFNDDN